MPWLLGLGLGLGLGLRLGLRLWLWLWLGLDLVRPWRPSQRSRECNCNCSGLSPQRKHTLSIYGDHAGYHCLFHVRVRCCDMCLGLGSLCLQEQTMAVGQVRVRLRLRLRVSVRDNGCWRGGLSGWMACNSCVGVDVKHPS